MNKFKLDQDLLDLTPLWVLKTFNMFMLFVCVSLIMMAYKTFTE